MALKLLQTVTRCTSKEATVHVGAIQPVPRSDGQGQYQIITEHSPSCNLKTLLLTKEAPPDPDSKRKETGLF